MERTNCWISSTGSRSKEDVVSRLEYGAGKIVNFGAGTSGGRLEAVKGAVPEPEATCKTPQDALVHTPIHSRPWRPRLRG